MAFDQGASRPQSTITAKSTGAPQNSWRLKLKKIQRIYRNIDGKRLVSSLFLNFNYLSFQRKKWGRGRKKVVGPRPYQPLPLRGPWCAKPCEGKLCFRMTHHLIRLKLPNFLQNIEKQMRKIRVQSPVVSNGRQYLGSGGVQLTCAMQAMLCSNILHLFLYGAHFC